MSFPACSSAKRPLPGDHGDLRKTSVRNRREPQGVHLVPLGHDELLVRLRRRLGLVLDRQVDADGRRSRIVDVNALARTRRRVPRVQASAEDVRDEAVTG